jgi:hypothetical protein
MAKMFKVVYGSPSPVEVEAEIPSYPHRDSNGDSIYENTHFLRIEDAWERHLAEHRAGLSLGASRVKYARQELSRHERELCDAALFYDAALKAHKEFTEGE